LRKKHQYEPNVLQAHCQSPTSHRSNQSFVKELAKPTQRKIVFKKFPDPSKKNKNATHNPTQTDKKVNGK
jgi:predicted metal-dependent RNase